MTERLVQLRGPDESRAESGAVAAPRPDSADLQPASRRVFIETYGCQMNINDTELVAGKLADRGYVRVEEPERADVILINTCAVRENAEQRVRGRIGQLQKHRSENPDLVLGVTGCMAQRIGDRLVEEMDGVDLVAGPDAYRDIGERIDQIRFGGLERGQRLLELDGSERYEGMDAVREEGVTAWITVQRGCDHRCTFCIVPYVRGGEKNRDPSAVLAEARQVVDRGYSEITLLGQTVNSYRWENWDFARLLRAVARVPGVRRVRFTSPHPNDVTERLVDVMAEEEAVCRQLHLPAQSGSDWMLKRMVRRYTVDEYLDKVRMLRERIPDIALSTDMIVGFPGEREVDFHATLDLMREVRYDDAFLYRYSPREGTPATRFPEEDFVEDEVAQRRLEQLIALHREIQTDIAESEVDRDVEVLVEEPARSEGDMLGRTERNKAVVFPGDEDLVGEYVSVRLTDTTGATFRGERTA